jgi:hypothetical protein
MRRPCSFIVTIVFITTCRLKDTEPPSGFRHLDQLLKRRWRIVQAIRRRLTMPGLAALVDHLQGDRPIAPFAPDHALLQPPADFPVEFAHSKGPEHAERALEGRSAAATTP